MDLLENTTDLLNKLLKVSKDFVEHEGWRDKAKLNEQIEITEKFLESTNNGEEHCKEKFCEAKVHRTGNIRLCENGHRWVE